MNISLLRSDKIYEKLLSAPPEKRDDIYRYEMMLPFKGKLDCYNIPLKPAKAGGYDVIMASGMLGQLIPGKIDETRREDIIALTSQKLWSDCEKALIRSLDCFTAKSIALPTTDYLFTILLADEESPYIIMNEGYCGDGGIPGYIMVWLTPNEYTLARLPVAAAHELNHNVRYQFIKWSNNVTLSEMLVSEGLAENFAVSLFGEDMAGPWVTKTDTEWLNEYIKPGIRSALDVQGLGEINAYMYGDEMARLQGGEPAGMPYCAGYACGYHLIKHFLRKTGADITEATLLPAAEILKQAEDFWTTKTLNIFINNKTK